MIKDNIQTTFRIGPIRPPSEAESLLLQITEGCTWNKCKFCQLYKHGSFRAFTVESVKKDIDVMAMYAEIINEKLKGNEKNRYRDVLGEVEDLSREAQYCYYMIYRWLAKGGENVFLQDGNSLAVKPDRIAEILRYLKEKFPNIKRITTYERAETLSKISLEDFKILKEAGLNRIHSGYESGADSVLSLVNKGTTSDQEILAGKNIKEAGIELSVYYMPGLGGKELSEENARETARVIREINPDFIRVRSAVIKEGTGLFEDYVNGKLKLCSENDKIIEIKTLIENTEGCDGNLVSDHIINLLQDIQGNLTKDREYMLNIIEEYLSLPVEKQKLFQAARRYGLVNSVSDLELLPESRKRTLEQFCQSFDTEDEWDEKMNEMMMDYI